jgi:sulfate permease, SulP family
MQHARPILGGAGWRQGLRDDAREAEHLPATQRLPRSGRMPPLFSSLRGWRSAWLLPDLTAGVLLAAIAVPEQLATARLAGLPAETGLIAFIAASVAFVVFGANRVLSAGADSTIAPIFAGGVAALCAPGTATYAGFAALLALMVGAILIGAALCRAGWIADLLSIPVTTGFLAGVSVHITVAELPSLLGLPGTGGTVVAQVTAIVARLAVVNPYVLMIGLIALGSTLLAERLAPRFPGALFGVVVGGALSVMFHLQRLGAAMVASLPPAALPHDVLAQASLGAMVRLSPLAIIVALVCMMQTATVARSFPADAEPLAPISPNFAGIGAGCLLAGLCGAFPVNASPPRTAAIVEGGGRSQLASLAAVACVIALLLCGRSLVGYVPQAALAGILIAIAIRIFRVGEMRRIRRRGGAEIYLVVASIALVVALPIEIGMLCSIALSLLQSIYGVARPLCRELARVPGTTVWWPALRGESGERQAGVLVFAPAAPITFTNVVYICRSLESAILASPEPVRLVIIEASGITEIDYTGAAVVQDTIGSLRRQGMRVCMARLSADKARQQAVLTGLQTCIGTENIFHSVEEAIAGSPAAASDPERSGERNTDPRLPL